MARLYDIKYEGPEGLPSSAKGVSAKDIRHLAKRGGIIKHRALRSRMMAPVDAPNSKGFDVKR